MPKSSCRGSTRASSSSCKNEKLFNLIKYAINAFRDTQVRATSIAEIYGVENGEVINVFPECNPCANTDCNEHAECVNNFDVSECKCPAEPGWTSDAVFLERLLSTFGPFSYFLNGELKFINPIVVRFCQFANRPQNSET